MASLRVVPCTGCSPRRTAREKLSGPAHSVDSKPPSRASELITRPWAMSASRRNARYTFDLPLAFGPVIRLSADSGATKSRSER